MPLNANPRTNYVTCPDYPDLYGKIVKVSPCRLFVECHFRGHGQVKIAAYKLTAHRIPKSGMPVQVGGTFRASEQTLASDKLGALVATKRQQRAQRSTAANEKSGYNGGVSIAKSELQFNRSIIKKNLSEHEENKIQRLRIEKGVNHKKGAKVRVSASEVQRDHE